MGLAMVYGIVKNHGGYVDLESEVGRGCTFTVYLPSVPAERAAAAEKAPADSLVRGAGRILVVDDEAIVREVIRRMLTDLGYQVDTAADGDTAVAFYAANPGCIGLVIIDMQMSPMDGRACFRALRQVDAGVRAILSTGYGSDGVAQQMIEEGMVGFVQKPFEAPRLSQAVAAAMAGGRGT
jgi:CheY-like chemotaxis protein